MRYGFLSLGKKKILALSDEYFVFLFSTLFYLLLYFNINNKTLLGLFIIYLWFFWKRFSDLSLAFFALYLLFLPIAKGKTLELTLIPSWMLGSSKPFLYSFTFTFSDLAVLGCFIIVLRKVLWLPIKRVITGLKRQDIFLVGFLVSVLASVFVSSQPLISWLAFLKIIRMTLVYFIAGRLVREGKFRKLVISILIASLLFEGAWSSLQFISGGPLGKSVESLSSQFSTYGYLASEEKTFFRSQGTVEHPNTLGVLLTVLLMSSFSLLYFGAPASNNQSLLKTKILPISILFGLLGLIFSGSRASWAIAIVVLVGIVTFSYVRNNKGKLNFLPRSYWLILGLCIAIALPMVIIPRLFHFYQTSALYGGLHYRFYLLEKAWILAQSSPLGVGIGTFPIALVKNFGFFTWPAPVHNLFGEILSETGIFGLVTFALFLIFSYQDFWKRFISYPKEKYAFKIGAFSAVSAFLLLAQFYPFLWTSTIFDYFWLFLRFML